MPQYTGTQSVLNASLGEFHNKGFSLIEEGDHIVKLFYRDERVDVFSQTGMTIESLRRTCQEYLEKTRCPFNPDAHCSIDKKYTCVEIECPVYFGREY